MFNPENRQHTETISPAERATSQPPIQLLAPGTLLGDRYTIEKVLGVGGSAIVYAAFDSAIRRRVALKVLRADKVSPAALTRFRREVRVARDVQSPYLGRIFDIEQSGDSIFLSLELIEGVSLREVIERGPMPIGEAVRIASAICQALAELHRLGIVHRDVKPGNVLIGEDGQVKLVDFGLARRPAADESRATENEAVVGTVEYLSPEQALGQEVDQRTDLYALGVVLFEMITGRVPHEGRSSLGTLLAQVNEAAPALRSIRRDTPGWLAAIVARLLEKKREDRYGSATSVLHDLTAGRSPRRRYARVAVVTALSAVILIVLSLAAYRLIERKREVRITSYGASGMAALDSEGRILWSNPNMLPHSRGTVATLADFGKVYVGIDDTRMYPPADEAHTLRVYDLRTGKVLGNIHIPSVNGSTFVQYSDTYAITSILAADMNEDGIDELIVTFVHVPYWPSYTMLYDSVTRHSYPVLIASGHHHVTCVADVNGDGRKEIILTGPNNRMGWYTGVAAVDPQIEAGKPIPESRPAASSADATYFGTSSSAMVWYALLPAEGNNRDQFRVDTNARQFVVSYPTGKIVRLGFDGFTTTTAQPAFLRNSKRAEAYRHLRSAVRLSEGKFFAAAVSSCDLASAAARAASDPVLQEWIARVRARTLVQEGKFAEGDSEFARIAGSSDDPADVAWDAAVAFHVRGRLDDAIRWYRTGLGANADPDAGRLKYEYLEGTIMALVEQQKWAEAVAEVDHYAKAVPEQAGAAAWFRSGIAWLATGHPESHPPESSAGDLFPYWSVEFRLSEGAPPNELLPAVDQLLQNASGNKTLLLTLKSELLRRKGDLPNAERVRRDAELQFDASLEGDTLLRGHARLIRRRFADLDRDLAQFRSH